MTGQVPAQRIVRTIIRTIHIGSVVMFMGSHLFSSSPGVALNVLIVTGLYLMFDQYIRDGADYFRYATFWSTLFKVFLLGLGFFMPKYMAGALWGCLIVGSMISHAPGKIRHYAVWGRPGPCASVEDEADS